MMPQAESSIVRLSRTTGSMARPDRAVLSGCRVRRIACTAEAFGFGPVSKLLSIARALRDRERIALDFFGQAVACEAASRSGDLFDHFRQLGGNRPEEYTDLLDRADMVLSVMEPQPAIEGAARDLPVGYVDSLPFVWEPVCSPTQLRAIAASVVKGPDEARRACRDLAIHDLQAVAHRVASRSFLQRCSGAAAPRIQAAHPTWVTGIISRLAATGQAGERSAILVSLAGQCSPL